MSGVLRRMLMVLGYNLSLGVYFQGGVKEMFAQSGYEISCVFSARMEYTVTGL
jgi:hypothetical protein